MKKLRRGRNEPPLMTSGIPETPIFDYLDMMRRHSYGHNLNKPETLQEKPRILAPVVDRDTPASGGLCWSGWCRVCGRTLISATTRSDVRPDAFQCWPCSRAAA